MEDDGIALKIVLYNKKKINEISGILYQYAI
jgi:hypothetical protein